ncbi:MAG: hypothetical protein HKN82_12040 [Akkermansiaceae bacterium]|nr:hypothetical protein [Akkermansiaceae bacterium]
MKSGWMAAATATVVLAGVLAWATARISRLEAAVATLQAERAGSDGAAAEAGERRRNTPEDVLPAKSGRIMKPRPAAGAGSAETAPSGPEEKRPEEALGDIMRAFAETEAGQALEQWGNKARAGALFGPLVAEFDFSGEEKDYFLGLAGSGLGAEDTLWRDLMGAKTREARLEIVAGHEAAAATRRTEMRQFLNSEEDFRRYETYEARVPEYEQMGGLRAVMQEAGAPLNADQEARLVEAMHEGRMASGISERWEGRAVMTQLEQPGMAERLASDWNEMQSEVGGRVDDVLEPAQREAFDRQQEQVLQGLTMGIRFAEAAFGGGGN